LKTLLILLISVILFGCSKGNSSCFKIGLINLAIESPSTESVFYEITDEKIIKKLAGSTIVADYLEPKFDKIIITKGNDTLDIIKSPRIKKSSNGIFLIYRTGRFVFNQVRDSAQVADIIKLETIEITLTDNNIIKLTYCE
jgi:hypothetical protein